MKVSILNLISHLEEQRIYISKNPHSLSAKRNYEFFSPFIIYYYLEYFNNRYRVYVSVCNLYKMYKLSMT